MSSNIFAGDMKIKAWHVFSTVKPVQPATRRMRLWHEYSINVEFILQMLRMCFAR